MNLHLFTLNLICYLRAELLHLEYITEHDTSQFMESHTKEHPEQENITYLPHKVYKKTTCMRGLTLLKMQDLQIKNLVKG